MISPDEIEAMRREHDVLMCEVHELLDAAMEYAEHNGVASSKVPYSIVLKLFELQVHHIHKTEAMFLNLAECLAKLDEHVTTSRS